MPELVTLTATLVVCLPSELHTWTLETRWSSSLHPRPYTLRRRSSAFLRPAQLMLLNTSFVVSLGIYRHFGDPALNWLDGAETPNRNACRELFSSSAHTVNRSTNAGLPHPTLAPPMSFKRLRRLTPDSTSPAVTPETLLRFQPSRIFPL